MYIGIDIGGTNLVAGVVDENNKIIARAQKKTGDSATVEKLCDDLVALARQAAENAGLKPEEIEYIGMGVPGAVDADQGVIVYTPNIPFRNTPIRDWFHKTWDVPVYVGNDANCAFLGEYYAGAASGKSSAVAVTLGTGVGVGAAVDGHVLNDGLEGGHMVIVMDGELCGCGRKGCWEQYSSATALKRLTREEMERSPESALWELCEGSLERADARVAFQAARAGDEAGKRVVDLYLKYLAAGITNLVNILKPEIVCLGGGVSNEADDLFLNPLRELVAAECYSGFDPVLAKCSLGNDAGIIGAALLGKA